jgi:hypothetical protein
VTSIIRNDLISLGFDEESWRSAVRPIEATALSHNIHNLLLIGVEDDDVVPVDLVRATYDALEHTTNVCVLYKNYGRFTPMPLVSAHILPFFERKLSP